MLSREVRSLSIEEIEQAAADFKEDLTRECERAVRRQDSQTPFVSFAAVQGKEYIDKFLYTLRMRAGSDFNRLHWPARARPIRLPKRG